MKTKNPDLQVAIDKRLSEALAAANYRITLNTQKKNAFLKLQKNLTLSTNGGTFNVTQELISFVAALIYGGRADAILVDVNGNPIEITDLQDFSEKIVDTYYECMNEYLVEIKGLNKLRTPKALVGEQ